MTEVVTGTETIRASIREGVGTIVLNRPERRNALNSEMCDAVPTVLDRFENDDDVGCIVITGAGSAFCAGGDVRGDPPTRSETRRDTRPPSIKIAAARLARDARMVLQLHESAKVTIASLPGAAVGAGLGIALSTDLRIAARAATLIPGWAQLGFSGDYGGSWLLTRLLGPSKAVELFVDNVTIGAGDALRMGLVNEVVADAELARHTFERARRIAAGPRSAWRLFKENVRAACEMDLASALPGESLRMVQSGRTADHRAALEVWLAAAAAKRRNRADDGGDGAGPIPGRGQ